MKLIVKVTRAKLLGEIAWIQGLLISGVHPDGLAADYLRKRHSYLTGALLDDGRRFFEGFARQRKLAYLARARHDGEVP